MNALYIFWTIIQILIGIHLLLPLILYLFRLLKAQSLVKVSGGRDVLDYAIIVTAYEQVTLLSSVVDSVLRSNYDNYLIFIIADKCYISTLTFASDRVILLRPEETLASNIKSHF